MGSLDSALRQRYGVYGRDWTDPDEGATNSTGTTATFKVLDQSIYSQQNNVCWHNVGPCIIHNGNRAGQWDNDGSWSADRELLHWEAGNAHNAAGMPEGALIALTYSAEEQQVIADYEKLIKDFMKEQRGLFITGNLDIDSDSDWENYIASMEAQGVNEWMAAVQSAYTRMFG